MEAVYEFKIDVLIANKPDIKDPEGETILQDLFLRNNYDDVTSVRTAKVLQLKIKARNVNEAKKIGKLLIKNKLAACVNIFPNIFSIYSWKDKLYSNEECSSIFKTTKTKVSQAIKTISKHHSYDCPAISAFPIEKIHTEFQKWVINQTAK